MANHITQWRPVVILNGVHIIYSTYTKIKRDIKKLLHESANNEIYVSRSKRGEWGEWFEYWSMFNGKPVITKQGWM